MYTLINEQIPEPSTLCEIYCNNGTIRKARFISIDGFNNSPLWTDEIGAYVIQSAISGWRYIHTDKAERTAEAKEWLSVLSLAQDY